MAFPTLESPSEMPPAAAATGKQLFCQALTISIRVRACSNIIHTCIPAAIHPTPGSIKAQLLASVCCKYHMIQYNSASFKANECPAFAYFIYFVFFQNINYCSGLQPSHEANKASAQNHSSYFLSCVLITSLLFFIWWGN